jgi:hypothetical protein
MKKRWNADLRGFSGCSHVEANHEGVAFRENNIGL